MIELSSSQIIAARRLWGQGFTLGTIAEILGCSPYDLSPWLYADQTHAALNDQSRPEGRP